jgi:predicted peptidase
MSDGFAHGTSPQMRYRIRPASGPGRAPLLVFLHGVGERGSDNAKQLAYPFFKDPASLFGSQTEARHPCHVLAPQADEDELWVDVPRWDVETVTLKAEPTCISSDSPWEPSVSTI